MHIYIAFASSCLLIFRSIIPQRLYLADYFGWWNGCFDSLIDDNKEITPMKKTIGILLAALVIYFVAGIRIDFVTWPVVGMIDLRWFSLPLTLLWILAITNAVNLIDGLDGLASGVSIIGLTTIGITGYFFLHAKTVYIPIVYFYFSCEHCGIFPIQFYSG